MIGNAWVGQRGPLGRIGISPYLYGQRQLLNIFFLPKLRDLPDKGLLLKTLVFDFGFADATQSLGPFATGQRNEPIVSPLLIWGVTGVTDDATTGLFTLQIYTTHLSKQRQVFTKSGFNGNLVGTAQNPFLLRSPLLLLRGDQIKVEVKNGSDNHLNGGVPPANARVQVCLWGGEFE